MNMGLALLTALVLLMLTGVLLNAAGNPWSFSRSPVFAVLGAALTVLLAGTSVCAAWRREWASAVTHMGVAVILTGGLIDARWAIRGNLLVPVGAESIIERLELNDNRTAPFGFGVSVERLDVTFYDPDYYLHRPRRKAPVDREEQRPEDYERIGKFRVESDGFLYMGKYGRLKTSLLRAHDGEWTPTYRLDDGSILKLAPRTPQLFDAVLRLHEGNTAMDRSLRVNHPVSWRGWKFYLISYGDDERSSGRMAVLLARRAPGCRAVIAGIWMSMLGVAVMCFRRAKASDNHGEAPPCT
jgi:hypothetical protein